MPDTITALFKDEAGAESAMHALKEANFDRASTELRRPEDAEIPDFGGNAARGVAIGSIGGTVLGVILGILASGVIPGSHSYAQGGWFVPFILAMALGATGGLAGLLVSMSASHERGLYFEQEVQSGRYMVSVDTDPDRLETAREILMSRGAIEASPIDSPTVKRSGRRVVE
jgi:MFS family permease